MILSYLPKQYLNYQSLLYRAPKSDRKTIQAIPERFIHPISNGVGTNLIEIGQTGDLIGSGTQ